MEVTQEHAFIFLAMVIGVIMIIRALKGQDLGVSLDNLLTSVITSLPKRKSKVKQEKKNE